jgi:hypothetical protein
MTGFGIFIVLRSVGGGQTTSASGSYAVRLVIPYGHAIRKHAARQARAPDGSVTAASDTSIVEIASRETTPPGAALQGSGAPLISFSELRGDEFLSAEHLGLLAPVVPVLPQFVPVPLDLSER